MNKELSNWFKNDNVHQRINQAGETVSGISLVLEDESIYCAYIYSLDKNKRYAEVLTDTDLNRLKIKVDILLLELGYKLTVGI